MLRKLMFIILATLVLSLSTAQAGVAVSYDYFSPSGTDPNTQGWVYNNNYSDGSYYMGAYDTAIWDGNSISDPSGWRLIEISNDHIINHTQTLAPGIASYLNNGFTITWTFQMDSSLWGIDGVSIYEDYFINRKDFQQYGGILLETSTGFCCYLLARPDSNGNLTIYDQANTHTLTTVGNNIGYDQMVTVTITYDGTDMVMSYNGTDYTLYIVPARGYDQAIFGSMSTGGRCGLVYQEFTVEADLPGTAALISPEDSISNIAADVELSWAAGEGAESHNVYISDNLSAVQNRTVAPINTTATSLVTSLNYDTTYYWAVDEVSGGTTYPGDQIWAFATESSNANLVASYDYYSLSADPELQGWVNNSYIHAGASSSARAYCGGYDTASLWQTTTPAYTGPDGWRTVDVTGVGYVSYYTDCDPELAEEMKYGFTATWTFSIDKSAWSTDEVTPYYGEDWFLGDYSRQSDYGISIETTGDNSFAYDLVATADASGNLAIWDKSTSSVSPIHVLTSGGNDIGFETEYTLTINYDGVNAVLSYNGNDYLLNKGTSGSADRVSFGILSSDPAQYGSIVYQNVEVEVAPQVFAPQTAPAPQTSNLLVEDVILSWEAAYGGQTYEVYLSDDLSAVENRTVTPIVTADLEVVLTGLDYATTYYWIVDTVIDSTVYSGRDIYSFATIESQDVVVAYDYYGGIFSADPETQGWDYISNRSNVYLGGYDAASLFQTTTPAYTGPDGWRVVDGREDGYAYYMQEFAASSVEDLKYGFVATWTFSMDKTAWATDGVTLSEDWFLADYSRQRYAGLLINAAGADGFKYYLVVTADENGNLAICDDPVNAFGPTHVLTTGGNNGGFETLCTVTVHYNGTDAVLTYNGTDYPLYKMEGTANNIGFGSFSTINTGSLVYQKVKVEKDPKPKTWLETPSDMTSNLSDDVELSWSGIFADSYKVYVSDVLADVVNRTVTPLTTNEQTIIVEDLSYATQYYWAVDGVLSGISYPTNEVWTFATKANANIIVSYDYDGGVFTADPQTQGWIYKSNYSNYWIGGYDAKAVWPDPENPNTTPGWRVIDNSSGGYINYQTTLSDEMIQRMVYGGWTATWTFALDQSAWGTDGVHNDIDCYLPSGGSKQGFNGLFIDTPGIDGYCYYVVATADPNGNLAIWDASNGLAAGDTEPIHMLTSGEGNNAYETVYTVTITYDGDDAILSYAGNDYLLNRKPSRGLNRISFGSGSTAATGSVVYYDFIMEATPVDCGFWGYSPADLSGPSGVPDCHVDVYDLAKLAENWLDGPQ